MTREVWVISRDGTTVTTVATITHEDSSCVRPGVAFSPDGTQVAYFDVDCKPWIVNTDGSGQRQITSSDVNDIDPAWSPDGQWISFHRNCALWLIRPDASDGRRLLEGQC